MQAFTATQMKGTEQMSVFYVPAIDVDGNFGVVQAPDWSSVASTDDGDIMD